MKHIFVLKGHQRTLYLLIGSVLCLWACNYYNVQTVFKFRFIQPIARKTSQPLGRELQFLLEMYCQGSVYMTVKWVLGGMKDTPREMSDKLVEAMPPKLAEVFGKLKLL